MSRIQGPLAAFLTLACCVVSADELQSGYHKELGDKRTDMARSAIQLWERVIADGQDQKAVAEAKERLPALTKIAQP